MSAATWAILLIAGLAAVGVAVGAIVSTIFKGGKAGLVGLGALFGLVGAAGGWWMNQHDMQPRLAFEAAARAADASPDVAALKRYYPTDYTNMQRALAAAAGDRSGAAGAQYLIRLHIRDVMTRQVKLGGDKELVALMTLTRDEATALSAKSPGYCLAYFAGGRLNFDPAKVLPSALVQRDAAVAATLFQQTATNPQKDAAGAHADEFTWASRGRAWDEDNARKGVAARALSQFPAADQAQLALLAKRRVNLDGQTALQTKLCKYKIALLDEALKLQPAQAAMVYRLNQGT
ncbi:hypothetical protein QO010_000095 [Caulobacter ginsengisoli]|uniref:Uncharacterized protein n=1 Tax=Caulobacter ginsengisoli TaxID=400775 RepID=A0ABU0IN19_9CAUL|nr:hypothetical protein [Caulobacter ginsengisoli]MDQ0462347.1 hypothetical protein [Caulobacter ginsengisoli]